MSELLPCPFCNGNAVIERMGSGRVSMIYTCEDCGCRLQTSETFLSPHCSWNTRAPSPTPVTVSEEMVTAALRAWYTPGVYEREVVVGTIDEFDRKDMRSALIAALTTNKKG